LDLKATVSDQAPSAHFSAVERSESDLRMVSMFLWEQGRFPRFLKLIAARDKGKYSTYFEAAMDLPMDRILPLWQSYLEKVEVQRQKIYTLPASTILSNEQEFRNFVEAHNISVEQSKPPVAAP
jgi:hypothetical protein